MRTRGGTQTAQYIEAVEQPTALLKTGENVDSENILPYIVPEDDLSRTSLASFVRNKGADAHYDFIICAAAFNEKKHSIASFSSATLKDWYADVKRPLPNNVSMTLSELVRKGLIMPNPSPKETNPKEYVLTIDGVEAVNKMIPKEGIAKKAASKPRKPRPKTKSIYSDINCDELNLDKYPEVKSLKDFKDKMMMVLYIITNETKEEWFTTADVLCLLVDIFGEFATEGQVKGVFKREKLWFKTESIEGSNKEVKRKLLNGGINFAKSLDTKAE